MHLEGRRAARLRGLTPLFSLQRKKKVTKGVGEGKGGRWGVFTVLWLSRLGLHPHWVGSRAVAVAARAGSLFQAFHVRQTRLFREIYVRTCPISGAGLGIGSFPFNCHANVTAQWYANLSGTKLAIAISTLNGTVTAISMPVLTLYVLPAYNHSDETDQPSLASQVKSSHHLVVNEVTSYPPSPITRLLTSDC